MKFLIAPNALKGSLTAFEAASAMQQAVQEFSPENQCILCPVADGGDGTLDVLRSATGGTSFNKRVSGPLHSMEVDARWGMLGDKSTAVIEMAQAAGLQLLQQNQYDVAHTTTYGVGELMLEAAKQGCKKILVGLGGSATNDGGAGCAKALGVKFYDSAGKELPEGGIHLPELEGITIKNYELGIMNVEIVGLVDVKNMLFGSEGAAFTFARQKGATEEQVRQLDLGLRHYASIIERTTHRDVSRIPGSGAAGGLGAGLVAFCNARLVPGIDLVLDTVGFDDLLMKCDAVLTAEGMLDSQTIQGKAIDGIARRAVRQRKPVHVFAGRIRGDASSLRAQLGLASLQQISPEKIKLEVSMKNASSFLSAAVKDFLRKDAKDSMKRG